MGTTRRDFIRMGTAGVSLTFFTPNLLSGPLFAEGAGQDESVLVILQLVGGNDAINTFIPYTDSRYRTNRPTLAIPESEIVPLDDSMGLHPALAPLHRFWQEGSFSFVSNVGFPTLDRSHFHCEDVWETGDEHLGHGVSSKGGWLGRWADETLGEEASSMATLAIGRTTPLGLDAESVIPAVVSDPETYDVLVDPRFPAAGPAIRGTLRSIYGLEIAGGVSETVRERGAEMFETIDLVADLADESAIVTYPGTDLGESFRLAARMLDSGHGSRAIWIKTGGYDTHSAQSATHTALLEDVGSSLAAFQDDLRARGLSRRVVVMAWSEFGRRVAENASLGTDHGKAGTVFLLGDSIRGGTFYGVEPDLGNLDRGDLRTDVDFRSVYHTLIEDWLGGDPRQVLGKEYENLGFVSPLTQVTRRRGAGR